jgi:hypothetical protein
MWKKKLKTLINACSEIYGACRHKPRFHRYSSIEQTPSTDECILHKKSLSTSSWLKNNENIAGMPGEPMVCQAIGMPTGSARQTICL